jgi:hypothetical protein
MFIRTILAEETLLHLMIFFWGGEKRGCVGSEDGTYGTYDSGGRAVTAAAVPVGMSVGLTGKKDAVWI